MQLALVGTCGVDHDSHQPVDIWDTRTAHLSEHLNLEPLLFRQRTNGVGCVVLVVRSTSYTSECVGLNPHTVVLLHCPSWYVHNTCCRMHTAPGTHI